jgi:hypothetical protein
MDKLNIKRNKKDKVPKIEGWTLTKKNLYSIPRNQIVRYKLCKIKIAPNKPISLATQSRQSDLKKNLLQS